MDRNLSNPKNKHNLTAWADLCDDVVKLSLAGLGSVGILDITVDRLTNGFVLSLIIVAFLILGSEFRIMLLELEESEKTE